MDPLMFFGLAFIVWLETTEPASEICTSAHIHALPEMCDAKFNRQEDDLWQKIQTPRPEKRQ